MVVCRGRSKPPSPQPRLLINECETNGPLDEPQEQVPDAPLRDEEAKARLNKAETPEMSSREQKPITFHTSSFLVRRFHVV